MKKENITSSVLYVISEHAPTLDAVLKDFLVERIVDSLSELKTVDQLSELISEWVPSESKEETVLKMDAIWQDLLDFRLVTSETEEEDRTSDELEGCCKICERETVLTRHHVRPKKTHAKLLKRGLFTKEELAKTVDICRPCHSAVHRAEDEETLAEKYYSIELIMTHPKVLNFIPYIQKQRVRTKEDTLIGLRFHK